MLHKVTLRLPWSLKIHSKMKQLWFKGMFQLGDSDPAVTQNLDWNPAPAESWRNPESPGTSHGVPGISGSHPSS